MNDSRAGATIRERDVPVPNNNVVEELIGQELYIHRADAGESVFRLNGGATIIWYACDGISTVGSISESIAEEYGIPFENARQDVDSVVKQLYTLDLVQLRC